MPDTDKSLDLLGLKPVADAVSTVTSATTSGVGAFLSRICLPAAEEFGFFLRDKVSSWRTRNTIAVATLAEEKLKRLSNPEARHAHPRLVGAVLEQGSWTDDRFVQEMWAGLLAASCTESGRSQANIILANILSQLTPSQARVLRYACMTCPKRKSSSGLIVAERISIPVREMLDLTATSDVHTLDLEFDHLRGVGLFDIVSGLHPDIETADMCPTALGLQLFIRSEGFDGSPLEFFSL